MADCSSRWSWILLKAEAARSESLPRKRPIWVSFLFKQHFPFNIIKQNWKSFSKNAIIDTI
ncbi:hypothetical protein bcgnr5378_38660 [Bacillus cereus]|nr:hypothetical protein BCM0074_4840 [Bacillus cereus]BCC49499.1 hypothetical protein BCJMU02_4808 [Bacillus cereus]BCC55595.1 hypothetical protein BCJMU07_4945 [Bacillus cereus]BCC79366.1 hypothetical protein BCJMU62_5057 [Bacillus cereus]